MYKKNVCTRAAEVQWGPRSRPRSVIELSEEGDRATDIEDIVVRTPEFRDKDFHCQHLGGKNKSVGLWVKDLILKGLAQGWSWACRLGPAASLKSRKLRLARRYIYFVISPWTSPAFLSCKIKSWQINSPYTCLARRKSTFGRWIARTWLSAVSGWGRLAEGECVQCFLALILGQWHYRKCHLLSRGTDWTVSCSTVNTLPAQLDTQNE